MIEINNLTAERINKDFFMKIAKKVLEKEKEEKTELSIALVGQARIKELNKKYRKKNRVTDVLSFNYDDSGEVVICLKETRKNALKYQSTFKRESARALIHGILHLLGYDHEKTEIGAEKMEEKENYYLELCQKII